MPSVGSSLFWGDVMCSSTSYLTPQSHYFAIGRIDSEGQAVKCDLFEGQLDSKAVDEIRFALNQNLLLRNNSSLTPLITSQRWIRRSEVLILNTEINSSLAPLTF